MKEKVKRKRESGRNRPRKKRGGRALAPPQNEVTIPVAAGKKRRQDYYNIQIEDRKIVGISEERALSLLNQNYILFLQYVIFVQTEHRKVAESKMGQFLNVFSLGDGGMPDPAIWDPIINSLDDVLDAIREKDVIAASKYYNQAKSQFEIINKQYVAGREGLIDKSEIAITTLEVTKFAGEMAVSVISSGVGGSVYSLGLEAVQQTTAFAIGTKKNIDSRKLFETLVEIGVSALAKKLKIGKKIVGKLIESKEFSYLSQRVLAEIIGQLSESIIKVVAQTGVEELYYQYLDQQNNTIKEEFFDRLFKRVSVTGIISNALFKNLKIKDKLIGKLIENEEFAEKGQKAAARAIGEFFDSFLSKLFKGFLKELVAAASQEVLKKGQNPNEKMGFKTFVDLFVKELSNPKLWKKVFKSGYAVYKPAKDE